MYVHKDLQFSQASYITLIVTVTVASISRFCINIYNDSVWSSYMCEFLLPNIVFTREYHDSTQILI